MRVPWRVTFAGLLASLVTSLLIITSSGTAFAATPTTMSSGSPAVVYAIGSQDVQLPPPGQSGSPGIIPCCGGGGYSYPPSSPYYGEYQWTSSRGTQVVYRKGQWNPSTPNAKANFGQAKVHGKHRLYRADLIGYTVEHAPAVPQGGGRYRYEQTFKSQYGRYITIVVATQEQQILKDGFPFGVITAFCNGYDPTCPAWVNIVGFNPA